MDWWRAEVQQGAVVIDQQIAAGSIDLAFTYNNRGLARSALGDPNGALEDLRSAEVILGTIAPESPDRGAILDDLAQLEVQANATEEALGHLHTAVQVWLRHGPINRLRQSLRRYDLIAATTANAIFYAEQLEDLGRDLDSSARAIAGLLRAEAADLRTRAAPAGPATAIALERVAEDLADAGQEAASLRARLRALDILEALDPLSIDTAISLTDVAMTEISLGELSSARGQLVAADAILQQPTMTEGRAASLPAAHVLLGQGRIARAQNDLESASMFARRALAIIQQAAPDSWDSAYALSDVGNVLYSLGDPSACLVVGSCLHRELEDLLEHAAGRRHDGRPQCRIDHHRAPPQENRLAVGPAVEGIVRSVVKTRSRTVASAPNAS
jgi:tetratricopeptide (TPR) repeat protein